MVGYRAFFIVRWQLFCRIVSFLLFCMFSSMAYGATIVACTGMNGISGPVGSDWVTITPLVKTFLTKQSISLGYTPLPGSFSIASGSYYSTASGGRGIQSQSYKIISNSTYGSTAFSVTCYQIVIPSPPVISMMLVKPSVSACEAETGTITVTSNDPTPNGGTVMLTFPDATTAAAAFAGKTATLTFADFGLPNGYSGVHKAGDILNFTASVTTAAGHTASSTAAANVIVGGLNVTITPAKKTVYPFLNNSRKPYFPGKYSTPVDIKVTLNNAPISGSLVSTQVNMVAGSETYGGHDHGATDGANKPTGTFVTSSGTTDAAGVFTTTYKSSEFSGQDELTATASFNGCTGTSSPVVITSKIPGLIPIMLPAGGMHQFVGGICEHLGGYTPWNPSKTAACGGATGTSNQFISSSVQGSFNKLLNEYSKLYQGAGLYINDASLEFGGMFDVSGAWCATCSHSVHRIGVDVDFALKDTSVGAGVGPVSNPNAVKKIRRLLKGDKNLRDAISFQMHPKDAVVKDHIHIWFKK